jgi:hypothetical protein
VSPEQRWPGPRSSAGSALPAAGVWVGPWCSFWRIFRERSLGSIRKRQPVNPPLWNPQCSYLSLPVAGIKRVAKCFSFSVFQTCEWSHTAPVPHYVLEVLICFSHLDWGFGAKDLGLSVKSNKASAHYSRTVFPHMPLHLSHCFKGLFYISAIPTLSALSELTYHSCSF